MAEEDLTILVIDQDAARATTLKEGLIEAGYATPHVISDLESVRRRIAEIDPDVIVIDLEDPDREMLENMFTVSRSAGRPVAMFVDKSDASMIEAAIDAGVSTYVVDGLKKERIKPILDLTVSRFNAVNRLRQELEATRTELAERKVIDRAKGILMAARGCTEEEAYGLLRKSAMDQNRRMAEVADSLVSSAPLLEK